MYRKREFYISGVGILLLPGADPGGCIPHQLGSYEEKLSLNEISGDTPPPATSSGTNHQQEKYTQQIRRQCNVYDEKSLLQTPPENPGSATGCYYCLLYVTII